MVALPKIVVDVPNYSGIGDPQPKPVHVVANGNFYVAFDGTAQGPAQNVFDTACQAFANSLVSQGWATSGTINEIRGLTG